MEIDEANSCAGEDTLDMSGILRLNTLDRPRYFSISYLA